MADKDWTGNGASIFKTLGAIEHIGSVVTSDGFYVWHFYRRC